MIPMPGVLPGPSGRSPGRCLCPLWSGSPDRLRRRPSSRGMAESAWPRARKGSRGARQDPWASRNAGRKATGTAGIPCRGRRRPRIRIRIARDRDEAPRPRRSRSCRVRSVSGRGDGADRRMPSQAGYPAAPEAGGHNAHIRTRGRCRSARTRTVRVKAGPAAARVVAGQARVPTVSQHRRARQVAGLLQKIGTPFGDRNPSALRRSAKRRSFAMSSGRGGGMLTLGHVSIPGVDIESSFGDVPAPPGRIGYIPPAPCRTPWGLGARTRAPAGLLDPRGTIDIAPDSPPSVPARMGLVSRHEP
jgi:hypothetical protein